MHRSLILATAIALLGNVNAQSHQFWANGEPVPAFVKSSCCGPADAHHLNPSAVHIKPDGVHIDGLYIVFPIDRVLPSQDGEAWAFWNPTGEPKPLIYCLFLPPQSF